jgi:hypothetical protein
LDSNATPQVRRSFSQMIFILPALLPKINTSMSACDTTWSYRPRSTRYVPACQYIAGLKASRA